MSSYPVTVSLFPVKKDPRSVIGMAPKRSHFSTTYHADGETIKTAIFPAIAADWVKAGSELEISPGLKAADGLCNFVNRIFGTEIARPSDRFWGNQKPSLGVEPQ
ncbi:hypothetical protein CBA19CS22_39545 [Caballeronia novacaledonica]|uniref:Uncharacterized protein n=1 Tax=Caballeronia novacaledonica TaxID=1544861 RepID=A0ACB5R5Z0_9BURK|nr:hypothetical protein CBA19CS22_39545 [Caballeronia novacaledonica]